MFWLISLPNVFSLLPEKVFIFPYIALCIQHSHCTDRKLALMLLQGFKDLHTTIMISFILVPGATNPIELTVEEDGTEGHEVFFPCLSASRPVEETSLSISYHKWMLEWQDHSIELINFQKVEINTSIKVNVDHWEMHGVVELKLY